MSSNQASAAFNENGAVELYYDDSKKLETKSDGARIYGSLYFPDATIATGRAKFGASDDLQIYHDGSNSRINNSTGGLYLDGGGGNIQIRPVGSEQSITAYANSAVELYYDGSAKLSTTSGGVNVTGALTVNGAALGSGLSAAQVRGVAGLFSHAVNPSFVQ
jgi:hypothetical protein